MRGRWKKRAKKFLARQGSGSRIPRRERSDLFADPQEAIHYQECLVKNLIQHIRPTTELGRCAACLIVGLGILLSTAGCGSSEATLNADAKKVAELETEFWKLMQVSMANPNNDKTGPRRKTVSTQSEDIKKKYNLSSQKERFLELVEQYKKELQ
jgi:hypothetical protein